MGKGIIGAKLLKAPKNMRLVNGIYELDENSNTISFYINKECIGSNTRNPNYTITHAKWFLVSSSEWSFFKKANNDLSPEQLFERFLNEMEPKKYSILTGKIKEYSVPLDQRSQNEPATQLWNELTIKKEDLIKKNPDNNDGRVYRLIPYSSFPEDYQDHIGIVALGKPRILFCNFVFPKDGYIPLEDNQKKAAYGQLITVKIHTHLMPNPRINSRGWKWTFEIINENGETLGSFNSESRGTRDYRYGKEVQIPIKAEWHKNHIHKDNFDTLYIRVSGTEFYTDHELSAPGKTPPLLESSFDSRDQEVTWRTFVDGQWVYRYSPKVLVPDNTLAEILQRREIAKTNQIVNIGDVDYQYKEYDPCGYSKISISEVNEKEDKEDSKRAPYVIFDEDELGEEKILDRTNAFFDVVAGETGKEIEIKVEGVTFLLNEVKCDGILLDKEETHNKDNIFQMEAIWTAQEGLKDHDVIQRATLNQSAQEAVKAEKDRIVADDSQALKSHLEEQHDLYKQKQAQQKEITEYERKYGPYPVVAKDNTAINTQRPHDVQITPQGQQKSNYDRQNVAFKKDGQHTGSTGVYEHDYDLVAQAKITGASNQILDYEISSSGSTAMMTISSLGYHYNKTLTIENKEYDPNVIGNLFEDSWLFNYLLLKKDNQVQTYFVPITSCRYPNQLVKIRVLPDMKWTLLIKFNFKEEDFEEFKKEYSYDVHAYYFNEKSIVIEEGGLFKREKTVAGLSFERTTTLEKKQKAGGFKGLLDLIKRIELSLTAEWKDRLDKKQEKDVIEGFIEPIYGFVKKIHSIAKLVGELREGTITSEDGENKTQFEKELTQFMGGRSLDGLWERLNRKPKTTELIYPSLALGASWYYAPLMTLNDLNYKDSML